MQVTVECILCEWNDQVRDIFMQLINVILLSEKEDKLREAMNKLFTAPEINENFARGYGAHHLWINQRPNGIADKMLPCRLLIVHF